MKLFRITLLFVIFLMLLIFQVNAGSEQAKMDLTIKNMSYICGCKPDKVNPTGDDQTVYQGNYCGFKEMFLIDIDFSNLPKDREIKVAELKLFCLNASGTGTLTFEPIIEAWDDQVTYNRRPKVNPEFRVSSNIPASGDWFTVNITPIIKAWQSGAIKNYGIMCSSEDSKDNTFSVNFPSNKADIIKFVPKVTVYFK